MELLAPESLFRIVDVAGVIGNGLLGGAVARAKGFDLIGFLILSVTSALGGGIMRDVMLGGGFPVALTDPWYLGGAVAATLIAYVLTLDGPISRTTLIVVDMLALGCWSATGTAKALAAGLGVVPAMFLGVLTGVGGGMLRDVMVNETPKVFGGHPVYATFGIVAAAEMALMYHLDHYQLGMLMAIVTATVFGVLARWRNWQLPDAPALSLPGLSQKQDDDER